MSGGVYVEDCTDTVIRNCRFYGLDVGVRAVDSDITISNTVFDGVGTAIKGTGRTSIVASNITHTEIPQANPLAGFQPRADVTLTNVIRKLISANV